MALLAPYLKHQLEVAQGRIHELERQNEILNGYVGLLRTELDQLKQQLKELADD